MKKGEKVYEPNSIEVRYANSIEVRNEGVSVGVCIYNMGYTISMVWLCLSRELHLPPINVLE